MQILCFICEGKTQEFWVIRALREALNVSNALELVSEWIQTGIYFSDTGLPSQSTVSPLCVSSFSFQEVGVTSKGLPLPV